MAIAARRTILHAPVSSVWDRHESINMESHCMMQKASWDTPNFRFIECLVFIVLTLLAFERIETDHFFFSQGSLVLPFCCAFGAWLVLHFSSRWVWAWYRDKKGDR